MVQKAYKYLKNKKTKTKLRRERKMAKTTNPIISLSLFWNSAEAIV